MILCAGENLIDMIQTGIDADGAPGFRAIAGGSPFNCARALGRLGAQVGYLTPISTDRMGDLLAATLEADTVAALGGRSARPTSLALVAIDRGQPRYQFYRNGVADRDVTLEQMRAALPAGARALHVGSIALIDGPDAQALAELVDDTRARGLFTSVDPNVRPVLLTGNAASYRLRLAQICAAADLVKTSDEDLAWWFPDQATDAAVEALYAQARPALMVVTRGAGPVIALRQNDRLELPATPVTALADTVGAGDTFMAALLEGLDTAGALERTALAALPADTLRAILSRAARAAAITCTRAGCNPPTRAEVEAAGG